MNRKMLFHRASAIFWAVMLIPGYLWWRHSILFLIAVSVYANVKADWANSEAADDSKVLAAIEGLRAAVEGLRKDHSRIIAVLEQMERSGLLAMRKDQ